MKRYYLFVVISLLCFSSQSPGSEIVSENSDSLAAVRLLSEYVSIPSVSGTENEAAYYIASKCREAGLIVEYINDSQGSVNFAASLYPLDMGKPNIIFHNHIDVVPAGDTSKWKFHPYEGRVEDGMIWGRGSMDNKGLGVIQLFAVSRFVEEAYSRDLPYNVTILFVSGEETGGVTGSKIVSENDFLGKFNPEVVIGEGGAGMKELSFIRDDNPVFGVSIVEKVNMWLKLSWKTDNAGHASIVEGEYASLLMINGLYNLLNTEMPLKMTPEASLMFVSLGEVLGGIKGRVLNKPDSRLFLKLMDKLSRDDPQLRDLITNKITLTGIDSEESGLNQSSNKETAYLDVRMLPGTKAEEVIEHIESVIGDGVVDIEVIERGPYSRGTVPEKFFMEIADAIRDEFEGANVIPMLFPASSDNNYFRTLGIPVYGINPMVVSSDQMKAIHNYNEFIKVEDVLRGTEVFTVFLESVLNQ
jgi:carboxypeptidase PM20D1